MEHVLDLDPGRRGPVDGREQDAAIRDADGQGEPGLELLDGELAVGSIRRGPVVARRELKLEHETPSDLVSRFEVGNPRPDSIPRSSGGLQSCRTLTPHSRAGPVGPSAYAVGAES